MPLLDHFHPPLSKGRHWASFHTAWATAIAGGLNAMGLPEFFFAEPIVHTGDQLQVDVAVLEEDKQSPTDSATTTATMPKLDAVAAPVWVVPAVFGDSFEIHVYNTEGGPRLVAAIELVSPSNKDRPKTRRAFAVKCADYLNQGIGCIIVDTVTSRIVNFHNEIMDLMLTENYRLPENAKLYATAYRPVRRNSHEEIEIWHERLDVGKTLPLLPLYVDVDFPLIIDFEETYQETCERLRVTA